MNQLEMDEFFSWCDENLEGYTEEPCDESEHYYYKGEMIGGWAGDCREFFINHNDQLAEAIRIFDKSNRS